MYVHTNVIDDLKYHQVLTALLKINASFDHPPLKVLCKLASCILNGNSQRSYLLAISWLRNAC